LGIETKGTSQMSNTYDVEYTDTFAGEANYCWVKRETVTMPELTHYGYDGGSNYAKANKVFQRELMKAAKAAVGLTGARGRVENWGDTVAFYPYSSATVMFINWRDE
jgi:hypothetical protein